MRRFLNDAAPRAASWRPFSLRDALSQNPFGFGLKVHGAAIMQTVQKLDEGTDFVAQTRGIHEFPRFESLQA